ncbi:tlde1 domain-containing protein [Paraburkholderia antibiotica]|uniref:DUF2778 domain-containing protein n=1 Tax=Paraburkholderia antibiotica TaxID=2728839 RepID=A0A7X9X1Q8_9BURK|nr:tlde1 domain-containing protein [Paraburkholderia antibiotica]NML29674.1 DUF2778 domain-containing protein [Paraburkholderia antibiotica]
MSDRYAAERGTPSVPACAKSQISLGFNGRFLTMSGPVTRIYAAVSGSPDSAGRFDHSLERQRERSKGPIPIGQYWIEPLQMWENHWYNLAARASWGNHRITIHVYPGTQTYGRGGFFIHGGTHAGSAGCINLKAGMDLFVRDLRQAAAQSPDCYIPLSVRY